MLYTIRSDKIIDLPFKDYCQCIFIDLVLDYCVPKKARWDWIEYLAGVWFDKTKVMVLDE